MKISILGRLKPGDHAAMWTWLAEFGDDVGFEQVHARQPTTLTLRLRAEPADRAACAGLGGLAAWRLGGSQ
jgi:hypothetical protein